MTALYGKKQSDRLYKEITAQLGGDSFVRAVPLIAQLRCRNSGIELVWVKGGPSTNGKRISMTDPGLNPSPRVAIMLLGDLSHEKGHVLDTDFDVWKACAHDRLLQALLNATEDPRIEMFVGRQSPSELRDIRESARIMAEDGKVATSWESPTEAFKSYVNLFGEVTFVGCDGLVDVMKKARNAVEEHLGTQRMMKLDGYLAAAYPGLKSTADAATMAQRLIAMLKDFAEEQKKEEQEKQEKPDSNSGSPQGDQSQSGGSGSNSGDQSSGGQPQSKSAQGSASGDQAGSPQPSGGDGASQILGGSIDPDKSVVDRRDGLKELIDDDVRQQQSSGSAGGASVLKSGLGNPRDITPNAQRAMTLLATVKADIRRVQLELQRLVSKAKRVKRTVGMKGTSLVGSRLAGVPFGDYRVFSQRKPGRFRTCAVKLLLDLSYSMKGDQEFLASQANLVLSEACYQARLPFEVDAFNGSTLYRAKAFGQSFPACRARLAGFNSVVDGGTPLGQAIFSSALPLVTHEEQRKLFIVTTDGAPNDPDRVKDMVRRLTNDGVEMVGVGIGSDAVKNLFEHYVVIQSAKDLAPTLINLLRDRVIAP